MSRGVNRRGKTCPARPARKDALDLPDRRRQSGFTLIELLAVIIVLAILAAIAIPRYAGIVDQAAQSAAQGALAEGYGRLKVATARYIADNFGTMPQALTDLSPDYMNATTSLGDYTTVLVQSGSKATVQVFSGTDTTGAPLASRTVDWP